MEEFHPFQYDYYGQTTLHPLGLAAVAVLGIAMLLVPRRYAAWPMIMMACFVSPAQRVVIFGLNFTLLRVMVLFGWVRVVGLGEYRGFRWQLLDTIMIIWAVSGAVVYIVQQGSVAALIFKLGESYDAIGLYFLFRWLVHGWDDLNCLMTGFIWISVPVVLAFAVEHLTGRNLFGFLGGVPTMTMVRDGRVRCQGAFSHPILAGTFWAGVAPLIAACWWRGSRLGVVLGTVNCVIIAVLCASSGPVLALILGALAAAVFPLRPWMRSIRWGTLLVLFALHLVRKVPVWELLSRVDLAGGSTGWHRYFLIDQAINHFGEWWLVGTRSTFRWGGDYPLFDITNQYVLEGVRGGLLTLVLFVVIIGVAYRDVGLLWRRCGSDRSKVVMAWALGVALFVHTTSFISISYFGQIILAWYLTLATIASLKVVTAPAPACVCRLAVRRSGAGISAGRVPQPVP